MAGIFSWRFPPPGITAFVLLCCLFLPGLSRESVKRFLFCCAFFLAGLFLAAKTEIKPLLENDVPAWADSAARPKGKRDTDPSFSGGVLLTGTVRETTRLDGGRIRLLLESVTAENEAAPLPGYLALTWRNPPPGVRNAGPGMEITANVRLRRIRSFTNPGTWDTETYWRDRGAFFSAWSQNDGSRGGKAPPVKVSGTASALWKTREALHARTLAALSSGQTPETGTPKLSQSAAVILALLFGDRSFCSRETLDLVAKATLAHSLALSGMHLGFAAAVGYFSAWLIGLAFPAFFLRLPRQKTGILLALPVCIVYLWLGGAPPSLLRAALMLLFWGALLWLNRPKVLMDGLIWAVAVILVISPSSIHDIRLQLSAISVAGIALATPLLAYLAHLMRKAPRIVPVITGMAGISIAAQAAVLPIVLDAFPGTGVWFPLNLIWLPLLGMWVMPVSFAGLACSALGLISPASLLFTVAELPCKALFALLRWMDTAGILIAPVAPRPEWPAMAGYWLLLLLLPAFFMRKNLRKNVALLAAALCLMAGPALHAHIKAQEELVRMTVIDVGQGQSILITWQGAERGRALIDGGGFATDSFDVGRQVVTPVLTGGAMARLDWIINSHPDADHLQGLLFPLSSFSVGHAVSAPYEPEQKTGVVERRDAVLQRRAIAPRTVRAGDTVTLAKHLTLEVLHPGEVPGKSPNDNALVLRLTLNGNPLALICGDVEKKGLKELLDSRQPLKAGVLILPHHGSASSFSPELYDAVRPQLAVASCGYANTWHFPADKIKDALKERSIPLLTTADQGQIRITWKNGVMHVGTARALHDTNYF